MKISRTQRPTTRRAQAKTSNLIFPKDLYQQARANGDIPYRDQPKLGNVLLSIIGRTRQPGPGPKMTNLQREYNAKGFSHNDSASRIMTDLKVERNSQFCKGTAGAIGAIASIGGMAALLATQSELVAILGSTVAGVAGVFSGIAGYGELKKGAATSSLLKRTEKFSEQILKNSRY